MNYDLVIVGGGPIGSSTFFQLAQKGVTSVCLVSDDPEDDPTHQVTYRYAGGCIRWFWDEGIKREMTTQTAQFVKGLLKQGVDLSAIEDYYHFVYRGVFTPALNIKSAALIQYFIDKAGKAGLNHMPNTSLEKVARTAEGYTLKTSRGSIQAKKVLLALGVQNEVFVPDLKVEHEKRQLFITDLPVDEFRAQLPHTIVPVGEGYGYVFLKRIDGQLKVVVGQEDIIEDDDETQAVDYFEELVEGHFGDTMPFLREAKVERINWGVDAGNKTLKVHEDGHGLITANCGSAVRACVYLGQQLAERLA